MFDGKNTKKIEYLDEERQKLWERIVSLEKQISERPSDIEKEAKQASKKAAEFKNKTEERLNQAIELTEKINTFLKDIQDKSNDVDTNHTQVLEATSDILDKSQKLSEVLTTITDILEEHPDLENEVVQLDSTLTQIEETSSKANTTYKGILTRKAEIDELHREIIGYEDENEEGELVKIEGLKSELETAYETLKEQSDSLTDEIGEIKKSTKEKYNLFVESNKEELVKIKENSKKEYDEIVKKIESLLPNALTAGLSSAFVTKKAEEEVLYKEFKNGFKYGILYLTIASILPIAVGIFFLYTGSTLTEVIERAPKIILSFLPLYIPLIWITISANKKVNLSKRLIEEYSHKQVLSMTIEGLSKQIENIEDSELSEELRVKLIRSFLEVTNENPGKLISNYQKSDNPILNILDRDKQEKPKKTIVQTVEERTKGIIEKAADEVEQNVAKNTDKE
ncbi:hypothetical protein [Mariniflexile maritimum]|uniref:hypothetical protein n=1 Tax=Mariniflexile maritimum TaxID=2682493 RepID=UPI0012F696EF|nr:hypothetical protein [Mariniflexile maritimum]